VKPGRTGRLRTLNKAVRQDQRGKDDDNLSEDDDTTALEWLPICSRKELATELVSPLFGI